MTLELTQEQRQLVEGHGGRPVEVVDPDTQRAYVLIAREQFEKVRSLLDQPESSSHAPERPTPGMHPDMFRSQQAFWRDLPELLKQRKLRLQWVCYHGDERIGIAKTSTNSCSAV